ncbi:hypothetical protein ADK76_08530 [Streptomyces griseoflavus]|nr:hypothetical protein ADK76_08530 [Streptomyces griseoflavus]
MAPIKTPDRRLFQLADALCQARFRAGLSRSEVAARAKRSVTTIHRAESGRARVPWLATRDIAEACRMDLVAVQKMWRQAGRTRLTEAPHVTLLHTRDDLAAALRRAWELDGEPSLRHMEKRAKAQAQEYGPLSRMSASRIRQRVQIPVSLEQLYAYLIACEVAEAEFPEWAQAWARAKERAVAASRRAAPPGMLTGRYIGYRRASAMMLEAGLVVMEAYPGYWEPWTARCQSCGALSRFTLAKVQAGIGCRNCRRIGAARAG